MGVARAGVNQAQWEILRRCARGEDVGHTQVALIIDSPWIPGYLGLSTLDYLTVPEVWFEANLEVERRFTEAIFIPGFWVEMGMATEPSAFGCKVSFYPDRPPAAHPICDSLDALEGVAPPNPLTDGLMPLVLNYYRRAEPRVREAGHLIKIVAARGPLTLATHLVGVSAFLLALRLDPGAAHRLLRVTATTARNWLQAQADALHDVEGVLMLDDIAGFISEKDYLAFAHPYLKEVFDAFPGALKLFHNDTNNPVSYRHIRALGADIFNFTHEQPLAEVRALTGPDLCLMGNVPPLEVLAQGAPDTVRSKALECMAAHGGRRGLLLSAGGGVSPGTPGENVAALIAAARAESGGAVRGPDAQ
ncbi:MAG TPA: uroporphyrinogen decarboxylase family protein [Candidatus Paceibacterota bacterium]|nr:uroporphyrinogen decarboxylase family protein [Candidatus Paceibacterota bacterium]